MAFKVHIEVVEINLNQFHNCHKITNETIFVLNKLIQALIASNIGNIQASPITMSTSQNNS
jgi:hypothetical protein